MSSEPGVSFDPRVVLRPRTLDEVFDLAMSYGREHRRELFRTGALLVGPALALTAALKLGLELSWAQTWAFTLVFASLLERAFISYAGRHLFGNAPSVARALLAAGRRPFLALTAAILIPTPQLLVLLNDFADWAKGFAVMFGFFWPFLLAWTIFFSIVVNLEGLALSRAAQRSAMLVSYRFGRAIAFVLTTGTIRVITVILADMALGFLVGFLLQLGEPFDTLFEDGGSWASIAAYYVVAPLMAVSRLFEYVDARTRLEGWDIQVRFKAIAARAGEERRVA